MLRVNNETKATEPDTYVAALEFRSPRAVLIRKGLRRWWEVALVNGLFLVAVIVLALNLANVRAGGILPLSIGLAVAYLLVSFLAFSSLPPRAMIVKRGILILPRPIRTASGSKVKTVSLREVRDISIVHGGAAAVNLVLADGTSIVLPESEIGPDGRFFLEQHGSRRRKGAGPNS